VCAWVLNLLPARRRGQQHESPIRSDCEQQSLGLPGLLGLLGLLGVPGLLGLPRGSHKARRKART